MSKLDEKLAQDRATREAARSVVEADLMLLRQDWGPEPVMQRLAARTGAASTGLSRNTVDWAKRHGTVLAATGGALVSAAAFWFARAPILRAIGLRDPEPMDPEDEGE